MLIPQYFDVHTHTQFAAFTDDQDTVIRRALDAGVWLVNVGTQRDTSVRAVETARRYPEGVYAAVGLHPIHTEKSYHDSQELGDSSEAKGFTSRGEDFDYEYYKELARDPRVVAIGECGLDYYRFGDETKKKQQGIFVRHVELAAEVKKPLMIHCRNAFGDLTSVLQATSPKLPASLAHFFTGTVEDAGRLLDMGFSFSFGGVITFAREYDEAITFIPLERIVLETDAPYVAPVPYRGKRNEPLFVAEVARKLAEIKSLSVGEVARVTTMNALQLFGIKDRSVSP